MQQPGHKIVSSVRVLVFQLLSTAKEKEVKNDTIAPIIREITTNLNDLTAPSFLEAPLFGDFVTCTKNLVKAVVTFIQKKRSGEDITDVWPEILSLSKVFQQEFSNIATASQSRTQPNQTQRAVVTRQDYQDPVSPRPAISPRGPRVTVERNPTERAVDDKDLKIQYLQALLQKEEAARIEANQRALMAEEQAKEFAKFSAEKLRNDIEQMVNKKLETELLKIPPINIPPPNVLPQQTFVSPMGMGAMSTSPRTSETKQFASPYSEAPASVEEAPKFQHFAGGSKNPFRHQYSSSGVFPAQPAPVQTPFFASTSPPNTGNPTARKVTRSDTNQNHGSAPRPRMVRSETSPSPAQNNPDPVKNNQTPLRPTTPISPRSDVTMRINKGPTQTSPESTLVPQSFSQSPPGSGQTTPRKTAPRPPPKPQAKLPTHLESPRHRESPMTSPMIAYEYMKAKKEEQAAPRTSKGHPSQPRPRLRSEWLAKEYARVKKQEDAGTVQIRENDLEEYRTFTESFSLEMLDPDQRSQFEDILAELQNNTQKQANQEVLDTMAEEPEEPIDPRSLGTVATRHFESILQELAVSNKQEKQLEELNKQFDEMSAVAVVSPRPVLQKQKSIPTPPPRLTRQSQRPTAQAFRRQISQARLNVEQELIQNPEKKDETQALLDFVMELENDDNFLEACLAINDDQELYDPSSAEGSECALEDLMNEYEEYLFAKADGVVQAALRGSTRNQRELLRTLEQQSALDQAFHSLVLSPTLEPTLSPEEVNFQHFQTLVAKMRLPGGPFPQVLLQEAFNVLHPRDHKYLHVLTLRSKWFPEKRTGGPPSEPPFPEKPNSPTPEEYKAYMVAKYKHQEWENAMLRYKKSITNEPPPWKKISVPLDQLTLEDINTYQLPPSFDPPARIPVLGPQPKPQEVITFVERNVNYAIWCEKLLNWYKKFGKAGPPV